MSVVALIEFYFKLIICITIPEEPKKFGVATENSHLDSTSLSVEGEYKKEYPTVEILKSGAVGEEIETGQQPIKLPTDTPATEDLT